MALIPLNRHILLRLPRHTAAQIHLPQRIVLGSEPQYYRRRKLIVTGARSVDSFEDVDRVPAGGVWGVRRCCEEAR